MSEPISFGLDWLPERRRNNWVDTSAQAAVRTLTFIPQWQKPRIQPAFLFILRI